VLTVFYVLISTRLYSCTHPRAEEAPKALMQRRRKQRDDDRCGNAAAHQDLQRHRGGRRFRVRRQIRVSDVHAGAC